MSQVNTRNYTLDNFLDLAARSDNNAELRIRKSNQELSNTPLGFISRNFGSTHANSNIQANHAFMRALTSDPRYVVIANQLRATLAPSMITSNALTPAKITSAMNVAENMAATYQEGLDVAQKMNEFKIFPESLNQEFANFLIKYKAQNPDFSLNLDRLGDIKNLPPAQNNQSIYAQKKALQDFDAVRLQTISNLIKDFLAEGDRLSRAGGYTLDPALVDGDVAKAKELSKLFLDNANMPQLTSATDRQEIINAAFSVPKNQSIASDGSPLSQFEGLSARFAQNIGIIIFNADDYIWKDLSIEDIKKIGQEIPKDFSPQEKKAAMEKYCSWSDHLPCEQSAG